jgi:hypothetical protein
MKQKDIQSTLDTLNDWEYIAFDNNEKFLQTFAGVTKAWILNHISFDSNNMRFVYILDSGQHVSDSVKVEDWLNFVKDIESGAK